MKLKLSCKLVWRRLWNDNEEGRGEPAIQDVKSINLFATAEARQEPDCLCVKKTYDDSTQNNNGNAVTFPVNEPPALTAYAV